VKSAGVWAHVGVGGRYLNGGNVLCGALLLRWWRWKTGTARARYTCPPPPVSLLHRYLAPPWACAMALVAARRAPLYRGLVSDDDGRLWYGATACLT